MVVAVLYDASEVTRAMGLVPEGAEGGVALGALAFAAASLAGAWSLWRHDRETAATTR